MAASAALGFEDFGQDATGRWYYVQDGVMGGVSQGRAGLDDGALRMVGTVSTANNGGFIQVRQQISQAWPADAQGLRLVTKGNGERYYIFLRTPELNRYGWSYRAAFVAGADWGVVELPFSDFAASSSAMPQSFTPDRVVSIGIVAYGRDHDADLSVSSVALY